MKKILFAFSKQAFAIVLGSMLVLESVFPLAAFAQEVSAPSEPVEQTQTVTEPAPETLPADPSEDTEGDAPSGDETGEDASKPTVDETPAPTEGGEEDKAKDASVVTEPTTETAQPGVVEDDQSATGTEGTDGEGAASAEMQSFGASMRGYSSGPVAEDDSADTTKETSVVIDVLSNDTGSNIYIWKIHSAPSNGTAVIEGGKIKYTPKAGFVGEDTFTYKIKDKHNKHSEAKVTVKVKEKPAPTPNKATIIATKIVCDAETDLPNWGLGGPDITEAEINDFLASHPSCKTEAGWQFQWAPTTANDPGNDLVGEAGAPWTTFPNATDSNGRTAVEVDLTNVGEKLKVREVLKDGYIPFTYHQKDNPNNDDAVSAEMYCHNDVLNYDNYDFILGHEKGKTYHCVAFNVEKDNGPELPTNSCGIDPASNRTIVDITTTTKLLSNSTEAKASKSVAVSLPAGTYDVTLVAFDGYSERKNVTQPKESWLAILKNGATEIVRTNATADLADKVEAAKETNLVNTGLVLSQDATTLVAYHAAYPDNSNPNSVIPVCAVFDKKDAGGGNNPPDAVDDSATTPENTSVLVDVLANDTDPDNDTLIIDSTTAPSNGSAAIEGDDVRYTPNNGFTGTDTFQYTISDGEGGTDTATVTITVTGGGTGGDPKEATIIATKIVCDAETDLPNWGLGGDDITENRINDFLSTHPNCRVVSGWQFQWAPAGSTDPGRDFTGEAGAPWTTFPNATDASGEASVKIDVTKVGDRVWVREVLKSDYIPFTYDGSNPSNDDAVSAEMYCHTDVLNYDNFDFVLSPDKDKTYRCVAFNVEKDGNGGNNPPIAVDDSATTPEDTSVLIDVLANDSDPDGDVITILSTTTPSNGSIVHEGDDIRYTPNTDYTGTDTFEYTIEDVHGATDTAVVTITITDGGTGGGNNPPIANDDATTTPKNVPVLINVLVNDTDPDGDTVVLDGVSAPSNGTAVIEAGQVRYTPNTDFVGTDTFNYGVNDGEGGTDSATVTVVVTDDNGNGGNNPPVASDDSASTPENTSVLIDVLANDIDPDGDAITITATTTPSNGTIVHEGDDIRYTPNTDYTGTDTFEYTIEDVHGATDTAVVTITVTDDNGGGGNGDDDDDDDNGGGGGGGRRRTPRDGVGGTPDDLLIVIDQPLVLGASTGPYCPTGDYLTTYMRRGQANDPQEVRKLQTFLRNHLGLYASLPITGVYDEATEDAVSQFQTQYASDVLYPWGISQPTGYAYIYTIQKINDIMCGSVLGESKEGGFIKEGGSVSAGANGSGNGAMVGLIGATSTGTSTGFMDNVAAALGGAADGMSLYLLLILILLIVGTVLVIRGIMLSNHPEEYKKMRDNLINGSTGLIVATVLNVINTLTLMSDLERGQLRTGFGYKGLVFLDTVNALAIVLIAFFYVAYAYQRRKRSAVAHG